MKKAFSMMCAVLLVLMCVPFSVGAAETKYSGTCGDDLTWAIDDEGTLTISGTGAMENWYIRVIENNDPHEPLTEEKYAPWYSCPNADIQNIIIEDGATTIGDFAFRDLRLLKSVTIPDSVKSVGESAFQGCVRLTDIKIPDSVTKIGKNAFAGCTALAEIAVPNGVTVIDDYTFSQCENLADIKLPNSLTTIGEMAFDYCASLSHLTLPDGVKTIGDAAFFRCYKLESIKLSDSLTTIGDAAFDMCQKLAEITLPDSLTTIGEEAFAGCTKITEITIPKNVASIGKHAFEAGQDFASIKVDPNNKNFSSDGVGVLFNKDKTAVLQYPCGNKSTEYTLPDGVETIVDSAFSVCLFLESINVPESVTTIEYGAFYSCYKLEEINIPLKTFIADGAFSNCGKLTLSVYDGTFAHSYAKKNNLKFKIIELPETVESEIVSIAEPEKAPIEKGKFPVLSVNLGIFLFLLGIILICLGEKIKKNGGEWKIPVIIGIIAIALSVIAIVVLIMCHFLKVI